MAGIQYEDNNTGTSTIAFIQTEEGKAVPLPSGGYDYQYYLGDNLCNTRVTFSTKTSPATAVQTDDYLPFGMEITRYATNPKNEYLYNKKELQEELGEYDYGARFYDPVIGRWNVVDAYAEHPDQINLSPYAYVGNNPVDKTDPDGNCPCYVGYGRGAPPPSFDGSKQTGNPDWDKVSEGLNTAGTVVAGAGYALSPFTAGGSLVLVPVGEGGSTVGTAISATKDFSERKYGSAITSIALDRGFGKLGKLVEESKGIKTVAGKIILRGTVFAGSKVAEKLKAGFKTDHPHPAVPKIAPKFKADPKKDKAVQDFFKKAAANQQTNQTST